MKEDQKYREANLFRRLVAEGLMSVPDFISKLKEIDKEDADGRNTNAV